MSLPTRHRKQLYVGVSQSPERPPHHPLGRRDTPPPAEPTAQHQTPSPRPGHCLNLSPAPQGTSGYNSSRLETSPRSAIPILRPARFIYEAPTELRLDDLEQAGLPTNFTTSYMPHSNNGDIATVPSLLLSSGYPPEHPAPQRQPFPRIAALSRGTAADEYNGADAGVDGLPCQSPENAEEPKVEDHGRRSHAPSPGSHLPQSLMVTHLEDLSLEQLIRLAECQGVPLRSLIILELYRHWGPQIPLHPSDNVELETYGGRKDGEGEDYHPEVQRIDGGIRPEPQREDRDPVATSEGRELQGSPTARKNKRVESRRTRMSIHSMLGSSIPEPRPQGITHPVDDGANERNESRRGDSSRRASQDRESPRRSPRHRARSSASPVAVALNVPSRGRSRSCPSVEHVSIGDGSGEGDSSSRPGRCKLYVLMSA